jgi:predicted RNase H-like HicB family nuclease
LSEAEQNAMEVAEELRKALAVKNREVPEKDAQIARLQKRCARS